LSCTLNHAIDKNLRLASCRDELGDEKLIAKAAVESFRSTVLPWKCRCDAGRAGDVPGITPITQVLGDELQAVVVADVQKCRVEARELLQNSYRIVGAALTRPDRLSEAAVLIDHVQELDTAAIGGGVELEEHRAQLWWILSPVPPQRTPAGTCPLLFPWSRSLQAFLVGDCQDRCSRMSLTPQP
jgi:hypothetical protein